MLVANEPQLLELASVAKQIHDSKRYRDCRDAVWEREIKARIKEYVGVYREHPVLGRSEAYECVSRVLRHVAETGHLP